MPVSIGRRQVVAALGGLAALWPAGVTAQQTAMPIVGFLGPTSADVFADRIRGFQRGLKGNGLRRGRESDSCLSMGRGSI
jgi:putative tryptophan/tyrosine transport system substrate-binding protein